MLFYTYTECMFYILFKIILHFGFRIQIQSDYYYIIIILLFTHTQDILYTFKVFHFDSLYLLDSDWFLNIKYIHAGVCNWNCSELHQHIIGETICLSAVNHNVSRIGTEFIFCMHWLHSSCFALNQPHSPCVCVCVCVCI